MNLSRSLSQAIEKLRRARSRRFAEQPGQRGPVSAVSLPRCAEASKQIHLEVGRPFQLVLWQLGNPLVEVISDPHGTHGVGAGRSGAHFEELVDLRHDRALRPLYHGEIWRKRQGFRRRFALSCDDYFLRFGATAENRSSRGQDSSADQPAAAHGGRALFFDGGRAWFATGAVAGAATTGGLVDYI